MPMITSPEHTGTERGGIAGWRLCVAPMIDVTDRHCRYFHRLLAPDMRLYTEMITTGALLHGDAGRALAHDADESPVALQLGGSEPDALARSARLGEQAGYDEINLNCGCPSDRVQKGAFGACLMADPRRVADGWKAMADAVSVPVTVKHRLGLDWDESYGFVRDFVGMLFDAGCRHFVVHARNAVLLGLSPKENRQVPPLRYSDAQRLTIDFPDACFVLNGGLDTLEAARHWQARFDGVMLGRAAWHQPMLLAAIARADDPRLPPLDEAAVLDAMVSYATREVVAGTPLRFVARPLLGWFAGRRGARQWRRTLSDARLLAANDPGLLRQAWAEAMSADSPHPARPGRVDGGA